MSIYFFCHRSVIIFIVLWSWLYHSCVEFWNHLHPLPTFLEANCSICDISSTLTIFWVVYCVWSIQGYCILYVFYSRLVYKQTKEYKKHMNQSHESYDFIIHQNEIKNQLQKSKEKENIVTCLYRLAEGGRCATLALRRVEDEAYQKTSRKWIRRKKDDGAATW